MQRKVGAMKRAVEFAKTDILTRTLAGEGINGSLGSYSPGYARYRQKKGRPIDHVYYSFSGQMRQSINTSVRQEGTNVIGEIAPSSGQNPKVVYTHRRSPWFGLTETEKRKAIETIKG